MCAVSLPKWVIFSCKGSTFPTLEKLVIALKYGEVDGILVDLYTAHYRNDLFNATWIVVSQIIPFMLLARYLKLKGVHSQG